MTTVYQKGNSNYKSYGFIITIGSLINEYEVR